MEHDQVERTVDSCTSYHDMGADSSSWILDTPCDGPTAVKASDVVVELEMDDAGGDEEDALADGEGVDDADAGLNAFANVVAVVAAAHACEFGDVG